MNLEERVRRLERERGGYRVGLGALALALLTALGLGATGAVQDDLRVRRLEVVNSQGTVVFSAEADKNGDGEWLVYSHAGKALAQGGTNEAGHGALHVMSKDGVRRVFVTGTDRDSQEDRGGEVGILNVAGRPAVLLASDPAGPGQVLVLGPAGKMQPIH
ncbi:MAG TPA: hypothetical protein VL359_02700 [bacterium]|nr:hypothetical protein [bacterium]